MDERRDGNGRRRLDDLEEGQGRVFDLLIGPEEKQMDGTTTRKTKEGMAHKVDVLYDQERNGGLRVRLTTRDRVLVGAAFLSASGAVIAGLVS